MKCIFFPEWKYSSLQDIMISLFFHIDVLRPIIMYAQPVAHFKERFSIEEGRAVEQVL
jgi:hypothetical protein